MSGSGKRVGAPMTSEAKIVANRRNAQRSTGPRTAPGKARVRRNAVRHGLAACVVGDLNAATEVDRIAATIHGPEACSSEREQAVAIAEAQVTLKQVRRARTKILDQMLSGPPTTDGSDAAAGLNRLLRLERYERRALSRRKRAVRLRPTISHRLYYNEYNSRPQRRVFLAEQSQNTQRFQWG
jgi:hypothetical protein